MFEYLIELLNRANTLEILKPYFVKISLYNF